MFFILGFSVSLLIDLENLPSDYTELANRISLLKRNCFASVFLKYFQFQEAGDGGHKRAVIHYRDNETM